MDKAALDIKNTSSSAPTPQNTPINAAPITSAFRPNFTSISEAMESQGINNPQYPANIQRRLFGLKYFQSKHAELEGQFQEEVLALEKKYLALYQPLYNKRSEVIRGQYEPSADEVSQGKKLEEEEQGAPIPEPSSVKEDEDAMATGIPEFWLTSLKNHPQISDTITERDEQVLQHLTDIRMQYMDKPGFKIEFEFAPNDFFSNDILSKTYYYQEHAYGGDFVYDRAEGCSVDWKEGKDLTIAVETKKQRHKGTNKTRVVKRTVPTESFFNFFSPPEFPDESEELDEEEAEGLDAKLEADYEVGEEFKDKIIPHAVDYFTGRALDFEDFAGDDDFEDDFYDDISEDGDSLDDDEDDDDDDDDDAQPSKGENAPECKQS
ncbi:NAP-domain-containing protein [Hesseltinella vesiculosa]|uniref:NAP-domain-containing protein n=1 Tax=Hesseltinella vesiculosa TaxID=101127 RepID=A0A1X2GBU3_9FUNG|nr:NAP-domain-containing protein [Hesseltinella vesiculosa]